jgi:2-amino-4-hydroxy-6-hydroxymethyldihydropteridine diphosphokinase/dihydroneopterin aldolase
VLFADIAVDYDIIQCLADDKIENAVDYSALASTAMAFTERTQFYLLEKLADSLVSHLLASFPRALSLGLRLQKNPAGWGNTSFSCSLSGRRSLAILGLGSNLGDRGRALEEATERLAAIRHCRLLRSSSLHRTAPLLRTDQPEFFNEALLIETLLSPMELLAEMQSIERAMGRLRGERYGPRPIDIDLLLFEGFVSSSAALTVPHPGLRLRRFWIEELADLGLILPPASGAILRQRCEQIRKCKNFTKE